MPDLGRPVQFGIFSSPDAHELAQTVERVQLAERPGLDIVGVQDHPYQRRFLDTFSLIGHLAAKTDRIRFFPDVAHLPLRPPAMLAKQAASLDVLSGGRFELGLGAGGFDQASEAMGAVHREPAEKLAALAEAIEILRAFWTARERGIRHAGEHYRLGGVKAGPSPQHMIGIWVGASGPKMLDLIGRTADGWVPSSPFVPPDRLVAGQQRIDAAANAAGRDPADIRRIYNVSGSITAGPAGAWLQGPAGHWVEELAALVLDVGIDTFVFWAEGDQTQQLHAWAEVATGVREAVAARRG